MTPGTRQAVVLFALRRESMFFLPLVQDRKQIASKPFPCWLGQVGDTRVLILEAGLGRGSVRAALAWLDSSPIMKDLSFSPQKFISAGFGGALDTVFHVGDVMEATEVVDMTGQVWPTARSHVDLPAGRLLTSAAMIGEPAEKSQLASKWNCRIVDMESAEVARHCALNRWPLLCLRSISDDSSSRLAPQLATILSDGRVSPWKLILMLIARPWLILQLMRLGRDTRRAGRTLASALVRILAEK